MKKFFLAIYIALFVLPSSVFAQEQINSYHSDVQIQTDSSLIVTEEIQVTATGDQIKRGIYRDFPAVYTHPSGQRYIVGFEVLEITKDGYSEPYWIERAGNGYRIYIGNKNIFLSPGEYTYTITYKTTGQLGFYENHDELYWNVTGNGWEFPITSASATIHIPQGVNTNDITATAYTGYDGSTAQNAIWHISPDNTVTFSTTQKLAVSEGLTIVTGWPKGFVTPPTQLEKLLTTFKSNMDYIIGVLSFLTLLWYYLRAWNKKGRDPKSNLVIAQYEPPQRLSPAMMRNILKMGPDTKAFAAAIINMAANGFLSIKEEKGLFKRTSYTLTKTPVTPSVKLASEENLLLHEFFSFTGKFNLSTSNREEFQKIYKTFSNSLKSQAGKQYYSTNAGTTGIGILLSFLILGIMFWVLNITPKASTDWIQPIILSIWFFGIMLMNVIFAFLMRTYTLEGRKLVDEINGFKLFLSVTEKDRLAFHNPPDLTPELFEKMLPFALALEVEHKWAEQFAQVFTRLEQQGNTYSPLWYAGSLGNFSATNFASTMGNSFAGAIAASSAPPGSGSGGSGGSSGGGGGGGGGGGW